jgi:hypothetical protein
VDEDLEQQMVQRLEQLFVELQCAVDQLELLAPAA